jgi:hypothetical protein
LYHLLLNTGLQNKDNPLYQVVYELIGQVVKLTADSTASGGSGSGTTTINQTTILQMLEGDGESGGGDMGPPGIPGIDGANGMVPYFIASTEKFTVPEFKQALFGMNIDVEGTLEIDGYLIEVEIADENVQQNLGTFLLQDEGGGGDDGLVVPGPQGPAGNTGATGPAGPIGLPPLEDIAYPDEFPSLPLPHAFSHINGADPLDSSFTVTTTGNIDDLNFNNATLIRMNNASLSTIRGLKAGIDGQRVLIVSIGAGQVLFSHQNAGSSAANRLINFVTVGATPLAAGVGYAVYQYDLTTARWRLVLHEQGDWITPTFAAGDYVGNGAMTVTVAAGDVTVNKYFVRGRSYYWTVQIDTFTTGGTPNTDVIVTLGGGFSFSGGGSQNAFIVSNNGGAIEVGRAFASSVTPIKFTIQRAAGANWANGTDNNAMAGSIFFGIQ